jgi:hypothetical protein
MWIQILEIKINRKCFFKIDYSSKHKNGTITIVERKIKEENYINKSDRRNKKENS